MLHVKVIVSAGFKVGDAGGDFLAAHDAERIRAAAELAGLGSGRVTVGTIIRLPHPSGDVIEERFEIDIAGRQTFTQVTAVLRCISEILRIAGEAGN